MAPLETKEKTANSLGFSPFILNPGILTKYHLLGLALGVWQGFSLGEGAQFAECREFSSNQTPIKSSEIVL
jgi:hypothetical protein